MRTGVTMGGRREACGFADWCEQVVQEIRFRPDRKQVRRELADHYEDHVEDLISGGWTREAAEREALEAMGNAEAVGRALNRVHKYWLGVLWQGSRVVLAVLAVIFLVLAVDGGRKTGGWQLLERTWAQVSWQEPPGRAERTVTPWGTVYLVTKPEKTSWPGSELPAYHATLWLETEAVQPRWSAETLQTVVLADQTGVLPDPRREPWLSTQQQGMILAAEGGQGWTRSRYDVLLLLDHRPEYLEVSMPHGQEPWSLRCQWEVEP